MTKVLRLLGALLLPCAAAAQQPSAEMTRLLRTFVDSTWAPQCSTDRNVWDKVERPQRCLWIVNPRGVGPETLSVRYYTTGKSQLEWNHFVGDSVRAGRFIAELSRFASSQRLTRYECGASNTPAGLSRGTLWLSDKLALHASLFSDANSQRRVLLVASDDPRTFPARIVCNSLRKVDRGAADRAALNALRNR